MKLDYIHDEIRSKKSQVVIRLVEVNVDGCRNYDIDSTKDKSVGQRNMHKNSISFEHESIVSNKSSDFDIEDKGKLLNSSKLKSRTKNSIEFTKRDYEDDEDDDCCNCCCGCMKTLCCKPRKKGKDRIEKEEKKDIETKRKKKTEKDKAAKNERELNG